MRMAVISSTDFESWPVGGMLYFLRDLLPYLSEYFDIELWGVTTGPNPSARLTIKNKTFPFFSFGRVSLSRRKVIPNLLRVVFSIWKNKERILARDYDVLYFHGLPLEIPFLKSKPEGVKIVSHVHGITNPFVSYKGFQGKALMATYEILRKKIIKYSDLVFLAADEKGYEEFKSMFEQEQAKIKKVHNFVNPELFYPRPAEETRKVFNLPLNIHILIYSARLSPQKDPCLALLSFKRLLEKTEALFLIAGDGSLLERCKNLSVSLGIKDKVVFLGVLPREKLPDYLSISDVYLYTSHGNGVPLSVLEALACGTPVVTTNVNGIHDAVIAEVTGFIAQKRDPQEIANLIIKAFSLKDFLRKNCIERAKNFTPEKAALIIKEEIYSLC